MKMKISVRNPDPGNVFELSEKYKKLTIDDKELLSHAIYCIHTIFDMDPRIYEFDMRFSKRSSGQ